MAGLYRLDHLDCIVWIVSAELYWYRYSWVRSEKLDFYALAGIMEEIILLLDIWDGRTGKDGNGTWVVWRDRHYQAP